MNHTASGKIAIGAPNSLARHLSENTYASRFLVLEYVKGEWIQRAGQSSIEGARRYMSGEKVLVDQETGRVETASRQGLDMRQDFHGHVTVCGLCYGKGWLESYEDKWRCPACNLEPEEEDPWKDALLNRPKQTLA